MLSDFLVGVGQLKFRGTSVLFRLTKSVADILAHISKTPKLDDISLLSSNNYSFETISEIDDLKINNGGGSSSSSATGSRRNSSDLNGLKPNYSAAQKRLNPSELNKNSKLIKNLGQDTPLQFLIDEDYELATHTVKVKRSGALVDIATLWDLEGATTPNILNFKSKFLEQTPYEQQ